MAAYGLYSHIQSNRRRSMRCSIGLFVLVYVMVYAGALIAEALSVDADLDTLMQRALERSASAPRRSRPSAPRCGSSSPISSIRT